MFCHNKVVCTLYMYIVHPIAGICHELLLLSYFLLVSGVEGGKDVPDVGDENHEEEDKNAEEDTVEPVPKVNLSAAQDGVDDIADGIDDGNDDGIDIVSVIIDLFNILNISPSK